jgi:CheY-like chemotaxis protein
MKQSPNVLLIDDEESIVKVVGEVLRCMGFIIRTATSAQEGVQTACAAVPDVIVCDVRMPGIGGEEVVLMLKAQPATAHIPIVLVSGYCEPGFEHLAEAFLPKPFQIHELSALINHLLLPPPTPTACAA